MSTDCVEKALACRRDSILIQFSWVERERCLAGSVIILLPIVAAFVVIALRGQLSAYELTYNLASFGLGGFLARVVFWAMIRRQLQTNHLHCMFRQSPLFTPSRRSCGESVDDAQHGD